MASAGGAAAGRALQRCGARAALALATLRPPRHVPAGPRGAGSPPGPWGGVTSPCHCPLCPILLPVGSRGGGGHRAPCPCCHSPRTPCHRQEVMAGPAGTGPPTALSLGWSHPLPSPKSRSASRPGQSLAEKQSSPQPSEPGGGGTRLGVSPKGSPVPVSLPGPPCGPRRAWPRCRHLSALAILGSAGWKMEGSGGILFAAAWARARHLGCS